jgi:hypothetical protein
MCDYTVVFQINYTVGHRWDMIDTVCIVKKWFEVLGCLLRTEPNARDVPTLSIRKIVTESKTMFNRSMVNDQEQRCNKGVT